MKLFEPPTSQAMHLPPMILVLEWRSEGLAFSCSSCSWPSWMSLVVLNLCHAELGSQPASTAVTTACQTLGFETQSERGSSHPA